LRAGCSALGLYWITTAWQQIFKDSLHVMVVGGGVLNSGSLTHLAFFENQKSQAKSFGGKARL